MDAEPRRLKTWPDVSFVMPCYNEEEVVGYTIPKLVAAFQKSGFQLELIAVDNGSTDHTGDILRQFAARLDNIVYYRVERNQGYGNGVRAASPCVPPPGPESLPPMVRWMQRMSYAPSKPPAYPAGELWPRSAAVFEWTASIGKSFPSLITLL